MSHDALGDRMKLYEGQEACRRFIPLLPIVARLDGRTFSRFTRGMARPFDQRMINCMVETTTSLVRHTNACMGYTQSDEIMLAWYSDDIKSQVWFDGRIQKMTSQLAAQGTLAFYRAACRHLPEFVDRDPTFDCRVWQTPTLDEAANVFLWREWDATKNSVSMAASAHFSHGQLQGKGRSDRHDLLHSVGVNWNDYPAAFKRGTYVQRRRIIAPFTADEIDALPPRHAARTNPDLMIERSVWEPVSLPPLASIQNRVGVIFGGAAAQTPGGENG